MRSPPPPELSRALRFLAWVIVQASASSRAFYSAAKASLWQQTVGLCSVGVVAISIISVRNLAPAGRSTPVIMFTIQVCAVPRRALEVTLKAGFDLRH